MYNIIYICSIFWAKRNILKGVNKKVGRSYGIIHIGLPEWSAANENHPSRYIQLISRVEPLLPTYIASTNYRDNKSVHM